MEVKFKQWDCTIEKAQYGNGRIALRLMSTDAPWEPIAVATVNVVDDDTQPDEVVIKYFSENEGMYQTLLNADKINEFFEIHSDELTDRIKEGLTILEACDYFIHPELTFVCGVFGNKNILAQINTDTKQIYLSERLMDQPLFNICTMLIEENEHFRTGMSDQTRAFQQHFINLYAKTLMDKNSIKI